MAAQINPEGQRFPPAQEAASKLPERVRMTDVAWSIDGIPIRLTVERWFHIVENHEDLAGYYDDVLDTIANPELILAGHRGSLIAVRNYGHRRYLMVIYRRVAQDDGFVITAFFTDEVDRKRTIWQRQ